MAYLEKAPSCDTLKYNCCENEVTVRSVVEKLKAKKITISLLDAFLSKK